MFEDFDDFWLQFLAGQGPAAGCCTGLIDSQRQALRELLRRRLSAEPDGSIHLTARAWTVVGANMV